MLYRVQVKRYKNYGFFLGIMVSLLFLVGITVYGFNALFLNKNNDTFSNSVLYAQVLNSSMPILKVTSFEEEDVSEDRDSIKGEFMKLLGMNVNNPVSIIGREVSLLKSTGVDTELPDTSGTGSIAKVDPFAPTPGMVSTTNQGTPGNSNTPGNAAAPGSTDSSGNSSTANSIDNPNIKKPLDNTKPEVLIYHTHTTESYDPNGNYNDDPSKNVCAVGDVLTDELENKYGINVAHDKTIHNSSFNASYSRSRETVNKYLNKYGDFKLIIDLHRDAAYSKSTVTTKMNGENVADIRFVLCKKNPHFDKNLAVANSLADISNKYFPGFFKDIYYYNYGSKYFNQDLSNNAILIEVGANINTMDESKTSGKYIARIIAEYLNGKK